MLIVHVGLQLKTPDLGPLLLTLQVPYFHVGMNNSLLYAAQVRKWRTKNDYLMLVNDYQLN